MRSLSSLTMKPFSSRVVLKNKNIIFKKGEKAAFICPGQGGQYVGMMKYLKHLSCYREVMDTTDEALQSSTSLEDIMDNGPSEDLNSTVNTGPAMLLYSYLTFKQLEEEQGVSIHDFEYGFGHSLGEFTGAAIAGSMSLFDAIRLARDRSMIMQKHSPLGIGTMMISNKSSDFIQEMINVWRVVRDLENDNSQEGKMLRSQTIQISAINSPNSTSIAGHTEIVDSFAKFCKVSDPTLALKKLPVSIAGH